MRKLLAFSMLASALGVIPAAWGQNAHFVTGPNARLGTGGTLIVSWKEAGLGNNVTATYTASANGTAVYACINNGGKHPSASNKETVNGPVSATGTFSSGKNGSITGSLTAEPPSAGGFSCPNGQTQILAYVSYSGITLTNNTFQDSAPATPSALSACLVSGDLAAELCPAP
jgi:hypothetical protein